MLMHTMTPPVPADSTRHDLVRHDLVRHELIRLGARATDKEDAIRQAGQLLVAAGCVAPGYENSMIAREQVANTYLGAGVAIPHGLGEDKDWSAATASSCCNSSTASNGTPARSRIWSSALPPDRTATSPSCAVSRASSRTRRALTASPHDRRCPHRRSPAGDSAPVAQAPVADLPPRSNGWWIIRWPPCPPRLGLGKRQGIASPLRMRHEAEAPIRAALSRCCNWPESRDRVVLSAGGPQADDALRAFHRAVVALTPREKAEANAPRKGGTSGPRLAAGRRRR
jgi:phosphocarrier protein FPr